MPKGLTSVQKFILELRREADRRSRNADIASFLLQANKAAALRSDVKRLNKEANRLSDAIRKPHIE